MPVSAQTIALLEERARLEFTVGDRRVGDGIRELLAMHGHTDQGLQQRRIAAAASAIANARAGRRGAPPVSNILDLLAASGLGHLRDEVLEDAEAAIAAAEAVHPNG